MDEKSCPFCGKSEGQIIEDDGNVVVRCEYCGAKGPPCSTVNHAKVEWDIRPGVNQDGESN